jgi:CHASE2 domain-containing sensor protein
MPYTRPIRRFYLTPPAFPTFVISVLLAIVALLAAYGHLALLHGVSAFTLLLIGYVVLLLGTMLRGV